ncbi:MAG: chromate efflux transporter [Betaproteobacteria bacterium]
MNSRSAISFSEALRFWLKLGFISFGGPAGQIAIMHRELVERKRWISERRFLHALNYCMVLPGPEAQQLATYIGWLMHGTWGGIVAGGLFVLPSLSILIALSWIYVSFGNVPVVEGLLYGIKPAVTAIVLFAAWRIGGRTLKSTALIAIAALAFAAIFLFGVPFPAIVLAAAVAGAIGGKFLPEQFSMGGHAAANIMETEAAIDDHTPTPPHAKFRWSRLIVSVTAGLAIWIGAMFILIAYGGFEGTLAQMGWFFTKAALLTFGGAYAVLPYVYQGAVETFQWLSPKQMIDGLALGETTPGPLIMVVAFVGYLGGWTKAVLGPEALHVGAVLAAMVVTFFTFLPSFLFILIGGPLVESTHGQMRFTAPLTAITAAVVGVIVNLGVFFAWKVWWPHASSGTPFAGGFEWFSMLLTALAATALLTNRSGVIPIIFACGAAGIAKTLSGF